MRKFECEVDQTKLRSHNGIQRTLALFWENACIVNANKERVNDADPVYTLKDYPHNGYPSLYEIYMDSATEYEAAMRSLGSWRHWQKLCDSSFFQKYIERWREERKVSEEAFAREVLLLSIVEDGNISAAKTILDDHKKKGAGRPTTEAVTGELRAAARKQTADTELLARMSNV